MHLACDFLFQLKIVDNIRVLPDRQKSERDPDPDLFPEFDSIPIIVRGQKSDRVPDPDPDPDQLNPPNTSECQNKTRNYIFENIIVYK